MYAKLAISSQQSLRETDVSEMAEESLENHRLKKPNQTKPNKTFDPRSTQNSKKEQPKEKEKSTFPGR